MRQFTWMCVTALCTITSLMATSQQEATPWVKSFGETKCSFGMQGHEVSGRVFNKHWSYSRYEPIVALSAAVAPGLECDLSHAGNFDTSRQMARVEYQVSSDLVGAPLAVTVVGQGFTCTNKRVQKPIYFDLARQGLEGGIGLGRYLYKNAHMATQVFSYIMAGRGTKNARWDSYEVGLQQSLGNHRIRGSFTRLHLCGHGSHMEYIGNLRKHINMASLGYIYSTPEGVEGKITYSRKFHQSNLWNHFHELMVGVSIPLSL